MAQCPTGEIPKLLEENRTFWQFFSRLLPYLGNGMGGYDLGAVRHGLDIYNVPEGQRPVIADKALVVISVITEIREKEKPKR